MGRNIGATLSLNSGNFFSGVKGAVSSLGELKNAVTTTNSATQKLGSNNQLAKWKNEISAAKVEISQAESALSSVKSEQERANAAFSTAKSKVSEIKAEQEQLNQKVKSGTTSIEDSKKKQEQLNQKMAQAKNEVEKTKTAQIAVKSKIDSAKAAVSEAKAKQEELNAKIKQGEANIEKEETAQEKLNNKIKNGSILKNGSSSKDSANAGIGSNLKNVGLGVAAFASTAAIAVGSATAVGKKMYNVAESTAAAGDQVDKMSQKLGLSRDGYQQWSYVMSQSGVDINNCTAGLKTLTNMVDDAKKGSSTAVDAFDKLGISVDDLKDKSREDIFSMTVSGLQGVQDENVKAAVANDLLGKSGQNLLPLLNSTAGQTELLKKKASDLGMVMSDEAVTAAVNFTDSLDTLKTSASGFKNKIGAEFLPGLTMITDGLTGVINGTEGAGDQVANGVTNIVNKISGALPTIVSGIGGLASSLSEQLPIMLNGLLTGISAALPEIVTAAGNVVIGLATGLGQQLPTLIPTIINGLTNAVASIVGQTPQFLVAGMQLVTGLAGGLINAIPQLISAIPTILTSLINGLMTNLPQLVVSGVQMIVQLAVGLITGIPQMIAAIPKMFIEFANNLIHMDWAKLGKDIWQGIKDGFTGKSNSDSKSIGTSVNNSISSGVSSTAGITNTATYNLGVGATNNLALGTIEMGAVGTNGVNNYTNALTGGQLEANTAGFSVGQSATSGLTFGSSGAGSVGSNVVDDFNNNILAKRLNGHAAGFTVGQSAVQGVTEGTNEMSIAGQSTVQKFSAGIQNNMGTATNAANQLAMQTAAAGATNISSTVTVTTTGIPEADSQLQSLGNTGQSIGDKIKSAYTSAMSDIKAKTNEAVTFIKSAFEKMQIVIPKPKIPVINVAEVSTQVGTQQVKIPKFDVQWNAAGGIFTRPTVLATSSGYQGFGEAGAEAVLPLETFWQNLRKYITESRGGKQNNNNKTENHNEINLNVYTANKSTNQFANELAKKIIEILKNM